MAGLLALMLLTEARRPARYVDGALVPLGEQDRGSGTGARRRGTRASCASASRRNRPGHYQLMAAVNAVHTDAPTSPRRPTGRRSRTLYEQLYAVSPTPVVALNRAVAIAELDGPAVGLAVLEPLALTTYTPWHASRADLLRRLDRRDEARAAYDAAIATSDNDAERTWLAGRRGLPVEGRVGASSSRMGSSRRLVEGRGS